MEDKWKENLNKCKTCYSPTQHLWKILQWWVRRRSTPSKWGKILEEWINEDKFLDFSFTPTQEHVWIPLSGDWLQHEWECVCMQHTDTESQQSEVVSFIYKLNLSYPIRILGIITKDACITLKRNIGASNDLRATPQIIKQPCSANWRLQLQAMNAKYESWKESLEKIYWTTKVVPLHLLEIWKMWPYLPIMPCRWPLTH